MHTHASFLYALSESSCQDGNILYFLISHTTVTVMKLFSLRNISDGYLGLKLGLKGTLNISNRARSGYLKVHGKASTDTHTHTLEAEAS